VASGSEGGGMQGGHDMTAPQHLSAPCVRGLRQVAGIAVVANNERQQSMIAGGVEVGRCNGARQKRAQGG
jgi:hypothetical protein